MIHRTDSKKKRGSHEKKGFRACSEKDIGKLKSGKKAIFLLRSSFDNCQYCLLAHWLERKRFEDGQGVIFICYSSFTSQSHFCCDIRHMTIPNENIRLNPSIMTIKRTGGQKVTSIVCTDTITSYR